MLDFQAYLEQAETLRERGLLVSGLGTQGHFTGMVNPTLLRVGNEVLRNSYYQSTAAKGGQYPPRTEYDSPIFYVACRSLTGAPG